MTLQNDDFFDLRQLMRHPEKAMEPHSSTLAWKIPWTEEAAVHGVTKSQT